MKIKLKDYIKELEEKINHKKIEKEEIENLYTWILFFQHERLVHLIVTFFTGISTILFLLGLLYFSTIPLLLLFLITLFLFIPYIFYYYYLENGVQKLYDLYFQAKKSKKEEIRL